MTVAELIEQLNWFMTKPDREVRIWVPEDDEFAAYDLEIDQVYDGPTNVYIVGEPK